MEQLFFTCVLCFFYVALAEKCGLDAGDKVPRDGLANLKQYPSLGHLIYFKGGKEKVIAKANLISSWYALTAASNLGNKNISPTVVRFGDAELNTELDCSPYNRQDCNPPPLTAEIAEFIIHPEYNGRKQKNNIAILKFKNEVKFSDYIQPICLPEVGEEVKDGELLHFGTYSNTFPGAYNQTGIKQTVILPVRNSDDCMTSYKASGFEWDQESMLCAGSDGRDSCFGDSGAALMKSDTKNGGRWLEVGILSFGPSKCGSLPSIYTKVSHYVDWIKNIAFKN